MATSQRFRMTRTTSALAGTAVLAAALVTVASALARLGRKPGSGSTTGTGQVFKVNPVQSSGNQDLTDMKDSDAAVPMSEYASVQLRNLDGSGQLHGNVGHVKSSTGTPAYSTTNTFSYTRHADQFEQVMGYFWVNQAQEYLQSLGFGSTLRPVIMQRAVMQDRSVRRDNSYFNDVRHYRIRLGKGGVDDAEDAEVIVHEYGHAVHSVPGAGLRRQPRRRGDRRVVRRLPRGDGGSRGGPAVRAGRSRPTRPASWTGTPSSYTSTVPHCLRRLDTNLKIADRRNQVHFDGQIWSRALWDIRKRLRRARQDDRGVGHDADRQPVPVCAGHVLLGGRAADLPDGGAA